MKRYTNLLILIGLLSFLPGCQPTSEEVVEVEKTEPDTSIRFAKNKILIQGRTDYYDPIYKLRLLEKDRVIDIEIDSLEFEIELEKEAPVIISMVSQISRSIPIFAIPGDSIFLDFKLIDVLNMRNTHKFSGDHASENALLSQLNQYLIYDNTNYNYLHDVEAEVFLQKMDSLQIMGKTLLTNFTNQGIKLDPLFIKYYQLFLDLRIKYFLSIYPRVFEKSLKKGKPVLSEEYQNRLHKAFPIDPVYLEMYSYNHALSIYYNQKSNTQFKKVDNPYESTKFSALTFETIDSVFTNQEIRDYIKFKHVDFKLRWVETILKMRINFDESKNENNPPTINKNKQNPMIENKVIDLLNTVELYKNINPSEYYLSIIEKRLAALELEQ